NGSGRSSPGRRPISCACNAAVAGRLAAARSSPSKPGRVRVVPSTTSAVSRSSITASTPAVCPPPRRPGPARGRSVAARPADGGGRDRGGTPGRCIGTVLLEWLAAGARRAGITEFYATTLWENQKMLGVFREAGFQTKSIVGGGEVSVRFPVADSTELAVAIAKREHRAEARS